MDDFLVSLYEEEQEKYAAADLRNLMGTLATDELEEFLNLNKVAVAGPPNPVLPSEEGGKLDKEQKKTDAEVSKMQDQGAPIRKEAMINRIQKIAAASSPKIQHEYKTGIIPLSPKRNAAMGAIGGGLLGGGALGAGLMAHATQGGGKLSRAAKLLAAGVPIATAALGAGSGAGLSALKRGKLKSDRRQIDKINKTKVSQGMGGIEDDMAGGGAAAGGMETTAAAKAELVARVMHVAEGAPAHIKQAAARFAGKELAKLSHAERA